MFHSVYLRSNFSAIVLQMNIHDHRKQKNKHQSAANTISHQKQNGTSTFQFTDNRPEAVSQRKLQDNIQNAQLKTTEEVSKDTTQLKTNGGTFSDGVVQLGIDRDKRNKRKKALAKRHKKKKVRKSGYESDDEYIPPSQRRKHRQTFSKSLRRQVIMGGALRNKNRMYVCPGCGMPLADRKGREIKTYYISKSKKRHNIVSGQLDHFPKWSTRLARLKRLKKSDSVIRADHDDPTRLRPLCRRCNQSHKFEKTKKLPDSGYSDEEYHSENEERDKEIWKKYRKDDHDKSGGGAGITA